MRNSPPPPPLPETYWVVPGQFLAGGHPCKFDPATNLNNIRRLLTAGINTVIDLTEKNEYGLGPYDRILKNEARLPGQKVRYHAFPIKDYHVPSRKEMSLFLDTIDTELSAGRRVYLHCYGGTGRTGTVVGCYLVRHGMNGAKALETINNWLTAARGKAIQSPETGEQREMVLSWKG